MYYICKALTIRSLQGHFEKTKIRKNNYKKKAPHSQSDSSLARHGIDTSDQEQLKTTIHRFLF